MIFISEGQQNSFLSKCSAYLEKQGEHNFAERGKKFHLFSTTWTKKKSVLRVLNTSIVHLINRGFISDDEKLQKAKGDI